MAITRPQAAAHNGLLRHIDIALGHGAIVLAHIRVAEDLPTDATGVDLMIEAAPEQQELKRAILAQFECCVRSNTVPASNTPATPITQNIPLPCKGIRALGTHWWNPMYLLPLVEVIWTEGTSETVTYRSIG